MADDRRSELQEAVQRQLDSGEFPGVELYRVWRLLSEVLEGQAIELFYTGPLAPGGGYEAFPRPALQLVVCTPALVYDCAFSASAMRYDVSFLAGIYRVAETWSEEQSVEGPPRKKLSVTMDFENYRLGMILALTAYGEKSAELHTFARGVYALTMTKGK